MWRFNGTFNSDGAVLLGHTFQMTANARFSTDSGKDVTKAATWESSISPSGLLTGLVAGIFVLFAGPAFRRVRGESTCGQSGSNRTIVSAARSRAAIR